jgi:hypothetical protein
MKKRYFFACMLAGITIFTSCDKEEEEETPETPTAATPANPIPAPSSADGALVAIQTANYINAPFVGEIYQPIGVGVAVFGNLSGSTFVDCGSVTANGFGLTKQSNGTYVTVPSASSAQGIDFSDDVSWVVAGNSSTSVPAFNHSPSNPMPSGPKYTGATSIGRTSEFTLSSSIAITGADSIIYNVISPTVTVSKTVAGSVGSVTFSATEMGTLTAGSGYVQIVPYNLSSQQFGGKTYYFINESVCTQSVTFN